MSDVHVGQVSAAMMMMTATETVLSLGPNTIENASVGKGDSLYSALRLWTSSEGWKRMLHMTFVHSINEVYQ